MNKKIENLIVSNLFLNRQSHSWNKLKNKHNLTFLEMGEFHALASKVKSTSTINIILFLQEMTNNKGSLKINNIKNLSKLIEVVCSKTEKEVVVSFSSWKSVSSINYAQDKSQEIINVSSFIKLLRKIQKKSKNLYLLNLDTFFAEKGFEKCFSNRDYYLFSSKVSSLGLEILINKINEIYLKSILPQSKVLVLDCDNTLWGGVLGEDGFNNIKIGQDGIGKVYKAFQNEILNLSKKGMLLTVSSKNNYEDVVEVFEKHKMMTIKKKDIISFKVNWQEKYKNIIEISKELNLGLTSFIFWDDNKLEREKMKKFLPEVNTIDVHDDISNWPEQLKNNIHTSKFNTTKEDLKKNKQYKMAGKFVQNKKDIRSEDEEINFLKSIKLNPKILKIENSLISRASQMSQKTNQFNFRTIRYSETNLKRIIKDKNFECRLVNLKDLYGDHGIIAMFILRKLNKDYCFIDTMLMSCRVLGRFLDVWIFNECRKLAKKKNYKFIISEFIKTEKNKTFEKSLELNGFKQIDQKYLEKIKVSYKSKNKLFATEVNKYQIKQNKIFDI